MKRLMFYGFAVAALIVASLGMATVASAANLPWLLPGALEGAGIDKIDVTSGETKLETLGGSVVTCKKDTAETLNLKRNPAEGEIHITFSECKSGIATCTGAGDASGVILALLLFKIVHDISEMGEFYAVLFNTDTSDVTFTCAGFVKTEVLGTLLCLILKPKELAIKHELHCKNNGTVGDPEETKWWFENLSGEAAFRASVNGGREESASENGLATMTCLEANLEKRCELMG
jgi:hypothetical protein